MKPTLLKTFFALLCIGFSFKSIAQPVGFITSNFSNDTVCAGNSALLVGNGINGLVDIWQISFNNGANWSPISGTEGDTQYPVFQIPNNTCYRFIHNLNADTSAPYCITVDDSSNAGTITGGGPQCGVANGTLTVNAYNGVPTGWYSSTASPTGPFTSLSNTGTTQSFSVVTTTYFAYITQNGVCPADTTVNTISITPYTNAGAITVNPTGGVCAPTNTSTLTVTGVVGTASATQGWQSAAAATGPWSSLSTTTNTYTATNLTSTTYYHYIAQSGICPADTSLPVAVTVHQPPVGGTLSGGMLHCGPPPASGTFTLTGYSGTIGQWQFSTNGGASWSNSSCIGTTTCGYSLSSPHTLYRVEVDNGSCPSTYSAIDSVNISANSVAGTLVHSEDTLCAYSFPGGTMSVTGYTGNSFQWEVSTNGGLTWNPKSGSGPNSGYVNLAPGTYMYHCIVQNNQCAPAVTNAVTVVVNTSPVVTILTNDTILDPGETITVVAIGTGTPSWTPANSVSSPTSFTTDVTPYFATDYVITVSDGSDCIDTDTLHVYMGLAPFSGFIANTLTPNGDSKNDAFFVENIEAYLTNRLEIFNEYGQPIYSASPYKNDWKGTYNGSRVPDGTYYYVLTIMDLNKEKKFKGFITILGGK
jgi:gliding motility-associated-like protein